MPSEVKTVSSTRPHWRPTLSISAKNPNSAQNAMVRTRSPVVAAPATPVSIWSAISKTLLAMAASVATITMA